MVWHVYKLKLSRVTHACGEKIKVKKYIYDSYLVPVCNSMWHQTNHCLLLQVFPRQFHQLTHLHSWDARTQWRLHRWPWKQTMIASVDSWELGRNRLAGSVWAMCWNGTWSASLENCTNLHRQGGHALVVRFTPCNYFKITGLIGPSCRIACSLGGKMVQSMIVIQ